MNVDAVNEIEDVIGCEYILESNGDNLVVKRNSADTHGEEFSKEEISSVLNKLNNIGNCEGCHHIGDYCYQCNRNTFLSDCYISE